MLKQWGMFPNFCKSATFINKIQTAAANEKEKVNFTNI